MGKRYEKSKREVAENKQTLEHLYLDRETLRNEYTPLQMLDSIRNLLDDEADDAIRQVAAVGELELEQIESETDVAEEEKRKITDEITDEIDKLNTGLEKLRSAGGLEFGNRAIEQSSKEYKKQINKLKKLLDEGDCELRLDDAPGTGVHTEGITTPDENIGDTSVSPLDNAAGFVPQMAPNRKTPRDLPATQYGFTADSSGTQKTYDSPKEMDQYLYKEQGSAYENFKGTCGLCACANILRLAGVNYSEKDMIDYAASTPNPRGLFGKLCSVNPFSASASGGTGPKERQAILEYFDVSSGIFPVKMDGPTASDEALEDIANYVAEGRGVILSVHASVLEPTRYENNLKGDFHAVTVTSVTRDKYGGVSGFYICDSNLGTRYYSAFQVKEALTGNDMNVTNSHIR